MIRNNNNPFVTIRAESDNPAQDKQLEIWRNDFLSSLQKYVVFDNIPPATGYPNLTHKVTSSTTWKIDYGDVIPAPTILSVSEVVSTLEIGNQFNIQGSLEICENEVGEGQGLTEGLPYRVVKLKDNDKNIQMHIWGDLKFQLIAGRAYKLEFMKFGQYEDYSEKHLRSTPRTIITEISTN